MNINSNNCTVYFKGDITVKLGPWFCGWIESTFFVYLPIILRQCVTMVVLYVHENLKSSHNIVMISLKTLRIDVQLNRFYFSCSQRHNWNRVMWERQSKAGFWVWTTSKNQHQPLLASSQQLHKDIIEIEGVWER